MDEQDKDKLEKLHSAINAGNETILRDLKSRYGPPADDLTPADASMLISLMPVSISAEDDEELVKSLQKELDDTLDKMLPVLKKLLSHEFHVSDWFISDLKHISEKEYLLLLFRSSFTW